MKQSFKIRSLFFTAALSLAALTAHGGAMLRAFLPIDGDASTNRDDLAVAKTLKWYPGAEIQFFYDSVNGEILNPALNQNVGNNLQTNQVVECLTRAIGTWNDARFGGQSIVELVIDAQDSGFRDLGFAMEGATLDGLSIISFLETDPFEDETEEGTVALNMTSFFLRDFDLDDLIAGNEEWTVTIPESSSDTAAIPFGGVFVSDPDGDDRIEVWLPLNRGNFKQGDIFEQDIVFNLDQTQYFWAWPENREDVIPGREADVLGSLDIQMIMTHHLGYSQGIANSAIIDSVMYPYFDPIESSFPSDPYRRRNLSFDDMMTAGMATGSFPASTGSIAGSVIEGSIIAGQAGAFADGEEESELDFLDEYVTQVPVFLCVRPDQLAEASDIRGDGYDVNLGVDHPDDVEVAPQEPDDNQGLWRRIAQVLTGDEVELQAGSGFDFSFDVSDDGSTAEDGGTGEEQGGGNPDLIGDDLFPTTLNKINSAYTIPGLAEADDTGIPVKYAVLLDQAPEWGLNPVQVEMNLLTAEDYPSEFYGGPGAQLTVGLGLSADANIINDAAFENTFVTASFNNEGRFSGAIVDGPAFLSGYPNDPRSYVVVESESGSFTNRFGAIGPIESALQIDDIANTAEGVWRRANEFRLRSKWEISDAGGTVGIPAGIMVTHLLTNLEAGPQTFTFRQVLDAFLFSRENPIYTLDDVEIPQEVQVVGPAVPEEVHFQTSYNNPALTAFINLRAQGIDTPDKATLALIKNINKSTPPGEDLTGEDQSSLDSGIALEWTFTLAPGASKSMSYIIGFTTPGRFIDTWIPYPGAVLFPSEDDEEPTSTTLYGFEDDPARIEPVFVTEGEVTSGIDIITNTGEFVEGITPIPLPEGSVSDSFLFVRASNAFPSQPGNNTTAAAVGDIDNDGDLDVITARFGGGVDPSLSSMNRIYINQQRVRNNGSVTYYFNDETFGGDGIPSTSDDRMPPPAFPEKTLGVVLADFNGDGWLDIFFTNRGPSVYVGLSEDVGDVLFPGRYFPIDGSPCRFYLNRGAEGPGYFTDVSEDVLPGLLNRGWDSPFGGNGNPSKAEAIDVDSDGDLDIVISQEVPITDEIMGGTDFFSLVVIKEATTGFIDAATDAAKLDDGITDSADDLFTDTLYVCEQVLINQINSPPYAPEQRRFQFVDETLGADDRVGTLTSLELAEDANGPIFDEPHFITFYDPAELDRMPPLSPRMISLASRTTDTTEIEVDEIISSPMGSTAVEPRFGQLVRNGSAGFYSVRATLAGGPNGDPLPFRSNLPGTLQTGDGPINSIAPYKTGDDLGTYGRDQAFFSNCDLFSNFDGSLAPDGMPDGYFSCFNYNIEYDGAMTAIPPNEPQRGIFAAVPVATTGINTTSSALLYDAMPLFVGVPDDNPANVNSSIVQEGIAGAWTGELADFEYRGHSRPLVMTDNDNGTPYYLKSTSNGQNSPFGGIGSIRGQEGLLTGAANVYFGQPYGPYARTDEGQEWFTLDVPQGEGESYGMDVGDLNRDSTMDVIVGFTTEEGILTGNVDGTITFNLSGTPASNQLLLNDGFATFTDFSQLLLPNFPVITMDTIAADIDNDGDLDILTFNALADNELFVNQLFTKAPDLNSDQDPTMLFESTVTTLPPVYDTSATPPFDISGYGSGQSLNTVVADMDNDRRMDLVIAEGGSFSTEGDSVQLLLNVGFPSLKGLKQFKPAGTAYPAPVLNPNLSYAGFLVDQGFNKDVALGDVNNDGSPDIYVVRPPRTPFDSSRLLINFDIDLPYLNSVPDPDAIGDAIFIDSDTGFTGASLPNISDPNGEPGGLILKAQGQRALMADVNNDGAIDIIVANGFLGEIGGAPNLLLLNDPDLPGNFIDATESHFPIIGNEGVKDNTQNLAVGDFDSDGDVDIIFFNQSNAGSPFGTRYLINDGDGRFTEAAAGAAPPLFNRKPRGVVVADFDGLGEKTEDKNHNGILDPGEDGSYDSSLINGVIDWVDKPNGTAGVWDGSLDVFIAMENDYPVLLINSSDTPGTFNDEASLRFVGDYDEFDARGADAGDIDLDGDMDIIVAEYRGGITRHARIYQNVKGSSSGGSNLKGFFRDISYEMPFARGTRQLSETSNGENDFSQTGWANDVDLIDMDNDGDLDVILTCQGNANSVPVVGSLNIAYTNRIVGANLNFKQNNLNQTPGNPIVFLISPPGAARGKTTTVEIQGQNFTPNSQLSFGDGVQVLEVRYSHAGLLYVDLLVSPTARLGSRSVTIQNPQGGQSQTKSAAFTVFDGLGDALDNAVQDRTWLLVE